MIGCVVVRRLNGVIIIIASRTKEGSSVDSESCNGVVEYLEDRIIRLGGIEGRSN